MQCMRFRLQQLCLLWLYVPGGGCRECQGKVFHQTDGKACAIYECTVQEKGLIHCGQCDQLPCEIWMKIRDPKYSDEEFEENVRMRVQALKKSTAESAS